MYPRIPRRQSFDALLEEYFWKCAFPNISAQDIKHILMRGPIYYFMWLNFFGSSWLFWLCDHEWPKGHSVFLHISWVFLVLWTILGAMGTEQSSEKSGQWEIQWGQSVVSISSSLFFVRTSLLLFYNKKVNDTSSGTYNRINSVYVYWSYYSIY